MSFEQVHSSSLPSVACLRAPPPIDEQRPRQCCGGPAAATAVAAQSGRCRWRSTMFPPRESRLRGGDCPGRCCRRDRPRRIVRSRPAGWPATGRIASPRPVRGHRGRQARRGSECGRAHRRTCRRKHSAVRSGSRRSSLIPSDGERPSRREWSPPRTRGPLRSPPAVAATLPGPPVRDCRRSRRGRSRRDRSLRPRRTRWCASGWTCHTRWGRR